MLQHTSFDSFVLLGDSITQYSFDVDERGFGAQLAHLFQRRLDIVNRGFSGYTTEQAIHLLPQFLPRQNESAISKIQFLTIFLGANDACLPVSPQHVALDRYEQNLHTLIGMVHNPESPTYAPHVRIILIGPPVIDEDRWAIRRKERAMAMDRDKDVTRAYAERFLKLGRQYQQRNVEHALEHHQVDVVDTWGLMMAEIDAGRRDLNDYLKDGVHLAAAGNDLIFEQIMTIVRTRYPAWDPESMPMHAPWWGRLNRLNPETDLLVCGNKK
ncbi:isoamyl acetate esterase [Entomortierella parvispora]|uniref:Isoamyl acetate esterase n=1 Tax=Entomortierella parvispora TaxID=205924 RepID=A0A9P3HJ78_9FUNG|nr:isoamyl acetate esterase [Entomortierella parvispora]